MESKEIKDSGGLLGGLTAYHLRMLCESPWNGGGGYTAEQVGRMTLDQIWFRLCDLDILKNPVGERTQTRGSLVAASEIKPDKDGLVKGRTADNKPIKARIGGKSLARRLMEEEEERKRLADLSPRERRVEARARRREQRKKNGI